MRLPGHSNDREVWSWTCTRSKGSCASDETRTAHDDNPHDFPRLFGPSVALLPESTARMRAVPRGSYLVV